MASEKHRDTLYGDSDGNRDPGKQRSLRWYVVVLVTTIVIFAILTPLGLLYVSQENKEDQRVAAEHRAEITALSCRFYDTIYRIVTQEGPDPTPVYNALGLSEATITLLETQAEIQQGNTLRILGNEPVDC